MVEHCWFSDLKWEGLPVPTPYKLQAAPFGPSRRLLNIMFGGPGEVTPAIRYQPVHGTCYLIFLDL